MLGCGLSGKEAAVYLVACQLGSGSAQEISQRSGVNRTTTYVCLETLEKQGFVSVVTEGKKTMFIPEHPSTLVAKCEELHRTRERQLRELSEALPELAALYNVAGKKPKVLFLDGRDGLLAAHQEFENLRGPYVQITNVDDARRVFEGLTYMRGSHQEKMHTHETTGRALLVTEQSFEHLKLAAIPVDVKLIHYEHMPIHGEVTVREDTVILYAFGAKAFVTIMRSQVIADTIRGLFELAWKGAVDLPGVTKEERVS